MNVFEALTQEEYTNIIRRIDAPVGNDRFACMYPYIGDRSLITLQNNDTFITLAPGESISIPINFVYWFNATDLAGTAALRMRTVSRLMAFDIRTSLFQDPITYKFIVNAAYSDMVSFELKRKKIAGIDVSKLAKFTPSTPATIATNTTSIVRGNGVKTIYSQRGKRN